MRNTAFIVCEYDPFHNGHAIHIRKTRESGAQRIVCIMSGNFVQRGEIAFCDKLTRARFAIENGADLVLELPLKYVVSGAPYFAKGAAQVIRALQLPGTLSFGASAPSDLLEMLASVTSDSGILSQATAYSEEHGASFAQALQTVVGFTLPDAAKALSDPNNILAVEYIKALRAADADADLFAVPRSLLHDALTPEVGIASARYLREAMRTADSSRVCENYVPSGVYHLLCEEWEKGSLPSDKAKFSVAAMARLADMNEQDLLAVNGVNQGLENRIVQCMKDCSDLYLLFDAVKTKRFTHARIRQILISAVLGIKKEALERNNPYVRVLGMNKEGRELLRELHKSTEIPLIMNLSEAPECEERQLDVRSGRLYDLCRPVPLNKNPEYALKPYVAG